MKRRPNTGEDGGGHDSFLDIVANMVGILIILVLVAGLRVKNAAANAQADAKEEIVAASHDLQQARGYLNRLQHDIHGLGREEGRIEAEQKKKNYEQVAWTAAVEKMRERLNAAESKLDDRARQQFDLNRQIDEARDKLQHVSRQHQLVSEAPEAVEIEVLPTPLSKTVNDQAHEMHFRLIGGKIARVPFNELFEDMAKSFRNKTYKLRDRDRLIDTTVPRDGFSLRYRLERIGDPRSLTGYRVTLRYAAIIPSGHVPSETANEALAAGSRFQQALSAADRRRATITMWVYPDSSASFRRLRKHLHENNWRVAARPMLFNSPIALSPTGTKSAAQ